jgi:hypothetical protein
LCPRQPSEQRPEQRPEHQRARRVGEAALTVGRLQLGHGELKHNVPQARPLYPLRSADAVKLVPCGLILEPDSAWCRKAGRGGMDDNLAEYLREVERALSRMRSEIRAQEIFIEVLLKAASGSIDENRESILTALWIAHAERTETHGDDDEIARFLAKFSARLDVALGRAPKQTDKREKA